MTTHHIEQIRTRYLSQLRTAPEADIRGVTFDCPAFHGSAAQDLLPHQEEVIAAVEANGWSSGIVHLPTAGGKTRIAIEIAARLMAEDPSTRVVWATHSVSLIRQGMIRLIEMLERFGRPLRVEWLRNGGVLPDADLFESVDVAFVTRHTLTQWLDSAGDGRRTQDPLRLALTGRGRAAHRVVVIYDECHELGAAKLQRALRRFGARLLSESRCARERFHLFGLSATPMPSATSAHATLADVAFPMKGRVSARPEWRVMVHSSVSRRELTERGILCPIATGLQEGGLFDLPLDLLEDVARDTMSSFAPRPVEGQTQKQWLEEFTRMFNRRVMSHPRVVDWLASRIGDQLATLGKTIVFAATIDAANRLVAALRRHPAVGDGRVTLVHSRMEDPEVAAQLEEGSTDYVRKELQIQEFLDRGDDACVMVNVGMLTTGFDDPRIRAVILARLTFSINLLHQMVGRGLRGPVVGGTDYCTVVDPIRLTEKYAVWEGYRPRVGEEWKFDARALDDDADESTASEDGFVTVGLVPVGPGTPIDLSVRRDVQLVLRAFLAGDAFATCELLPALQQVSPTVTPDEVVLRPAESPMAAATVATYMDVAARGVEQALGRPLAWLHALKTPARDESSLKAFLMTCEVVRARGIRTLAEWNEFYATRLLAMAA